MKWIILTAVSIAVIVSAIRFSEEPIPFSPPTKSSLSGQVVFDSTSTNSFSLMYPSKVHVDLQAGHYGVGATIIDNTGSHLLNLSFRNVAGGSGRSGEFTGNAGTYNVIISGPSSFAVRDVGKQVSYTLALTTVPIANPVRNWIKFYVILVPGLAVMLLLAFVRKKQPPVPSVDNNNSAESVNESVKPMAAEHVQRQENDHGVQIMENRLSPEEAAKEEAERTAKEYVRRRENVEDVQIMKSWLSVEEPAIYVVKGIARKHRIETYSSVIVAERHFELAISAKDIKVIDGSYRPEVWEEKNKGQGPPPEASEPIRFVDSSVDFMTNERINRLIGEGKINIREEDAIRQRLATMDYFERERFLADIERRPTK